MGTKRKQYFGYRPNLYCFLDREQPWSHISTLDEPVLVLLHGVNL